MIFEMEVYQNFLFDILVYLNFLKVLVYMKDQNKNYNKIFNIIQFNRYIGY